MADEFNKKNVELTEEDLKQVSGGGYTSSDKDHWCFDCDQWVKLINDRCEKCGGKNIEFYFC